MPDVLLIDNMPSTFLSVTVMMRANRNFSVTFDDMTCSIMHHNRHRHAGYQKQCVCPRSSRHPRAVQLCGPRANKTRTLMNEISDLWHQRVEHFTTAAVNRCGAITPNNLRQPPTKCDCCVKNKITKIMPPQKNKNGKSEADHSPLHNVGGC
ncbi:hypothetical protein H257_12662 [Aphanomyces astaci]|uniref:GAG-pre-integrase domain-containing protein n=1 Tax=Aphanomyces astaci TaxID=112090 RepID=W4FYX4_APHAT|nr:hypothetical protein H257_12662 [Aphanomyces astaci]ETV72186.1 hypothetical protein H257_12662 [Aphanomyces astaci]|eukprot:XP_009838254.1 hypothetical protein H257_12662 [Aphanomyces astaci]